MAKRVFFSFHYERDAWRAGIVRNSGMTKKDIGTAGFIDACDWEEVKKGGDAAIRRWIDSQLDGTSVTAVLIGKETCDREWVKYEIEQSYNKGNKLVGIYLDGLPNQDGEIDGRGRNPLDSIMGDDGKPLSSKFKTYHWINNNGYKNIGHWVAI